MTRRYNPSELEPKWQKIWADDKRYEVAEDSSKRKYYVSGMFPYPSAVGMHVGHTFEHAIVDAVARFQRANGANVLNPMGWDAFGLPAENYAIKTGTPPAESTKANVAGFMNQLKRLGASIDWSREINTSSPEYYKWTQWIFMQLFERGLAYQKEANQWWCPVDMTVLANEQVEGGKCWRCGSEVEKKSMKQWFFKITDYADALLDEIPALDWPEKIKVAQTNWIGRSEGAEIQFAIDGHDEIITVFTTRPDTIFGATFMVIAPEHPLAKQLANSETREAVETYIADALKKSEIERMAEGKEKTGVFTGSYAINPATGENIPVWVADYVLWGYGTGAVMAVPAHDERDYDFATNYELPITQVVAERFVDEASPCREGKEVVPRNVVMMVVKHPNEDKYLIGLPKGGAAWSPLMGGIDDGETPVETARRELLEETGLHDIDSIESVGNVFASEFYAAHKDLNRIAYCNVVKIQLASLDTDDAAAVDKGEQECKWVGRAEYASHKTGGMDYALAVADGERSDMAREGRLVNSGVFDGMTTSQAREEVVAWLEQQGVGKAKVTYKMRDWLVSRQRYWGAPIPIVHCEKDGAVAVPKDQLPVLLPEVEDFVPKGKSVLATATDWVETTCPKCGGLAKRETDTMDGYACSSWYLLRYTDPHNDQEAWSPEKANYWTPLDMYVGGDHAVAHLLYVRFWNHVFYDMGLVPGKEPVKKLVYHGLIGAEDGRKMSKSLGNVVDPLEVIDQGYGADALRTFELFLGPINENSQWSSRGIAGVYRFLNRAWTVTQEYIKAEKPETENAELTALMHRTIKKVTIDIHRLSFNTAIATLMEYVNELYKMKTSGFSTAWRQPIEALAQLLGVFAPHMAAELWQQLSRGDQLDFAQWPEWNDSLTVAETVTIIVQVNGKLRAKLQVAKDISEDEVKSMSLAEENVQKFVTGEPKKVIYVPGKLVSIVV
jgi:leucyl-tRNA synthetase